MSYIPQLLKRVPVIRVTNTSGENAKVSVGRAGIYNGSKQKIVN